MDVEMTTSQMKWINDKTRELLIEGSAGSGKGLPLDTLLPTPTGWVTMEDLQVGDALFDETGSVCHVTYKSPIHNIQCYRITFDDGSSVVCDKDHRWRYRHVDGRMTVKDTGHLYRVFQNLKKTYFNPLAVRMAEPLVLPECELVIPPYVLGVWLALNDFVAPLGCVRNTVDSGILRFIRFEGYLIDDYDDSYKIVLGLRDNLREYNLLGNLRVPIEYLRASYSQRLDLLRGLMDISGDVNANGDCELFISKDCVDGVKDLLSGLGIRYNSTNNNGRSVFKFTTNLPVFKFMKDKLELLPTELPDDYEFLKITNVSWVRSVPTQCITVDSPNSMFLCTENFIPTHNTLFACYKVIFYALTYPKASVYVYRKTLPSLKRTSWKEIRSCLDNMGVPYEENKSEGKITFDNKSQIFFGALDESSKVRSINADMIYIEQAEEVTNDEFYIELMLRLGRGEASKRKGGYSQMLMVVQPESEDHWIYKRFHEFTDATVEYEREKKDNEALGKPYRSYDEVLAGIQTRRKTAHFHYSENFKLPPFQRKYYDDLKNEDYELWLRYSAGKWGKLTDVVYPNYDTVVVRDIKDCELISFGVDFGFNNPSCFLLMGWYDSECYIYDEVYVTKHTNPEFIVAIKDMLYQHKLLPTHLNTGFADAAEPDRIEEFRQNDFLLRVVSRMLRRRLRPLNKLRFIFIHDV